MGKTTAPVRLSKAGAWAEAVTDFVADPKVGGSFRPADVAERFRSLILAESMDINPKNETGFGKNLDHGVVSLQYSLDGFVGAPKGVRRIGWIHIFMPRVDPEGVDVMPYVAASMKRKLPKPWHYYVLSQGQNYYWEQRQSVTTVNVDLAASVPEYDRTPNDGPWVRVMFSRPQSIGESD